MKALAILFQYSILSLCLTCSSFVSSFSLRLFIKFFLVQKSKSSTNLKHNQLKYYNFWLLGKDISCLIYPWDNVPRGKFSTGQLCRRQIILKELGGNIQGYCQGEINFGITFWEQSSRGQLSGGQYSSGDNCPGRGWFYWGVNIPGGSCLGGQLPRAQSSRRQISRGKFPQGQLCGHRMINGGVPCNVIKYKMTLTKCSKFGYETNTVWLLNYECNQFLVISLYLLRYQSSNTCVLIRLISHFWLESINAIKMAWCAFF